MLRHVAIGLTLVTACSGGDGGDGTSGAGTDTGSSGPGSTGVTSTTGTSGTSGATTAGSEDTTTETTGGTGATSSTSTGGTTGAGGSTTGIDPDPLCMDFCAKKAECGIDGGQTLSACQGACIQSVLEAQNPDCELATLSQLACVAGLTCDEVLQWAGGDPVGPGDYPCKYTDVAIGEDCF